MITKISDLSIGQTYYICFVKNIRYAKKAKLIGIINETRNFLSNKTEFYLEISEKNKSTFYNLVFAKEIGIGETKIEAKNNYGKFTFERTDKAVCSIDSLKD